MVKVVIIGAGIYGLVAAKTYLQLEPSAEVTIIDGDDSVGGVWSKKRIYRGLYAQMIMPMFEYYDFPMKPAPGTISDAGYISGEAIHTYLHEYATHFDLYKRIRFSTWVHKVSRLDDGSWQVAIQSVDKQQSAVPMEYIKCDKLMVANGPTSMPITPDVPASDFKRTAIHSRELGVHMDRITSPEVKRVVIVGGAKSSFDTAYVALKAGKEVEWLIRPGGSGAMVIFPPAYFGYSVMRLVCMRLTSKLSPSCFSPADIWYKFLHRTPLGRSLTQLIWGTLTKLNAWYSGYSASESFERLRPTPDSAFWCNNGLGCASAPDFWNVLHSERLQVHHDTISSLEKTTVNCASGRKIDTDYVVWCTGWNDDISIFDAETTRAFGLPTKGQDSHKSEDKHESARADAELDVRFPLLRHPEGFNTDGSSRTWKLYKRAVPLSHALNGDNSVVFLGQIHTVSTMMVSGVQALWAVAYLRGDIKLPPQQEVQREIADWNAWTKRRYLSAGTKVPYSIYDFIPYIDSLCQDLGIKTKRKSTFITEYFAPYRPSDYASIVREWEGKAPAYSRKKSFLPGFLTLTALAVLGCSAIFGFL